MASLPDKSALKHRPRRHSYSSIKRYLECPLAYYYSYVQRLVDEPSAAMQRGTRLHKLAEDYMENRDAPVPYDIRKIGLRIYQLREHGALAERTWLVNKDWEPVEDVASARLKAIIDVHWLDSDVLKIHDYKSGREYPSHQDQLELYLAIGLRIFKDAKRAEGSAIYIDSGREGAERNIIREMLPHICSTWGQRMDRIDDDTDFRPTAGSHCKRCAFRGSAGGPCQDEYKGP